MSRRLLFIGGSAGAGKSTAAKAISREPGVGWLQADTIWVAAHDIVGKDSTDYALLRVDEAVRDPLRSPGDLLKQHIAVSRRICTWLPRAIEFELLTHRTLIVDGAWLLPEFLAGFALDGVEVSSAIIHEADREALQAAMRARSGLKMVAPHHDAGARLSWEYGNWLAAEAEPVGVPVVTARPRETLLDRLRDALEFSR